MLHLLITTALLSGSLLSAAPVNDLYVCATINKNYVIGSKIVTTNGVFRHDGPEQWTHLGPNDTSIVTVAFDPRDPAVHYTAANNGCWRTLDGGRTWRITTSWDMTEPRDVAVDPHAPDHVYLALPDGVAVSEDRAQTWQRREQGLPERGKYTQALKIDRTREGRVLIGCETGIYLSDNAGRSWRRVLQTKATVDDIQQSPHDPRRWLAATQSDGALQSTDGGLTWSPVPGVPAANALYNLAFDGSDPRRLAIGGWGPGILTSEDGGKTWTERNAGLPAPHRVWRVGVDPDSGELYASVFGETLFVSSDFGRTWRRDALQGSTVSSFVSVPRSAARKEEAKR